MAGGSRGVGTFSLVAIVALGWLVASASCDDAEGDVPDGDLDVDADADGDGGSGAVDGDTGRWVAEDGDVEQDAEPKIVRANADRLVVVFTNIMLNAFDALSGREDGDKALKVSAARSDQRVILRFEDNGPGMTEEQIANAFEPFYSTKEPGAGTGLGLWICYDTIRRYGGEIRIESRPGEGTTVVLEIPSGPSPSGA